MNLKSLFALTLTSLVPALGQQVVGVGVSPVPIYPTGGQLGPESSNQYVFLDPQTLDVVVSYPQGANGARTVQKLELSNHVLPSVSPQVSYADGMYTYVYSVTNAASARQAVHRVYITSAPPVATDPRFSTTFSPVSVSGGWTSMDYSYRPGQWAVRWERQTPVSTGVVDQFSLRFSTDRLPGLGSVFFEGQTSGSQSISGAPAEAVQQLAVFQQLEFNSKSVTTVVPKFSAGTPKAVIAADFHFQLQRIQLRNGASAFIETTLSQLDAFLENAGASPDAAFPALTVAPTPGAVAEQEVYEAMRLALGF